MPVSLAKLAAETTSVGVPALAAQVDGAHALHRAGGLLGRKGTEIRPGPMGHATGRSYLSAGQGESSAAGNAIEATTPANTPVETKTQPSRTSTKKPTYQSTIKPIPKSGYQISKVKY